MKGLPKADIETKLDQKIAILAEYTPEGMDRALWAYQMCILVNNNNMNSKDAADLYKYAMDKWDNSEEVKEQIEKVSKSVNDLKSYNHYAPFNVFGQPFTPGWGMKLKSDLISRMSRVVKINGERVNLVSEKKTFYELDTIVKRYLNFPF